MGMVSEMLGLAPLGSSMIPAVFEERAALARSAGQLVMRLLKDGGPLPRDLVTLASLENACAIVAATGARPMRPCTFQPLRMRLASVSRSTMLRQCSSAHR
jgi:hypothetical protein